TPTSTPFPYTTLFRSYHKQLGPLTVKVFAGLMAADNRLSPDDPETTIRGSGFGGKAALEAWWNISDPVWSSLDVSWGSLHDTYRSEEHTSELQSPCNL